MTLSGTRPGAWLSRKGVTGADVLVGLSLLLLGQLEVTFNGVPGNALAAHLLWAAVAVAATFRRVAPVVFALVCVLGLPLRIIYELTPEYSAISPITTPLSVFGLGLYARGSRRSAALAFGAAFTVLAIQVWAEYDYGFVVNGASWQWTRTVTLYLVAATAGVLLRDRADRLAEVEARVAAMPPAESSVAAALSGARNGIAREVHAVVERCLGAISTAIHRARELLPADPPAALGATRAARGGSREAMDEMRRMLGLLRTDPAAAPPPPEKLPPAPSMFDRVLEILRDQLLIIALLVNGTLNAIFTYGDRDLIGGDLALEARLAFVVVTSLLFVPRRRWPVFTAVSVGVILVVRVLLLDDRLPLDLFVFAAVFVAGAYIPRNTTSALTAFVTLACAFAVARIGEPMTPFMVYVAFSTTTVAAWMIGVGCRDRVRQTVRIEALEKEERERRRDLAQRAIRTERLGVAREMHDLIGHGLTSITLQCAIVERVILDDADRADHTLKTIEGLTTEVRGELTQLLGALSGERDPALPELSAVEELIEKTRSAGQPVQLESVGDLASLPIGPSAAAYRIVQESLVNARKYAGRGEVRAKVERLPDRVAIEVDNPIDHRASAEGFGLGIAGMRERAETYGGTFHAGPNGSGEWRVQAEVPLAPAVISPLS